MLAFLRRVGLGAALSPALFLLLVACGSDSSPLAPTANVAAEDPTEGDEEPGAPPLAPAKPDAGASDSGKPAPKDGGVDGAVPPSTVRMLSTNIYHSCAVFASGAMKCWGRNESGELGLGDFEHRGDEPGEMGAALPFVDVGSGRMVLFVATGIANTCVILDDHTVKCFGSSFNGALGQENVVYGPKLPTGDAIHVTKLGAGHHATSLALGEYFGCALLDDGRVKCWGTNINGQLGLGDKNARGSAAGSMGDALPAVALGSGRTATAIATGRTHACAILDNGSVKCWGRNAYGQLGLGDTNDRGDQPGEMGDALPTVALGTGRTAKAITAEDSQTCIILDDDRVKCWGHAGVGQLGLGDQLNRGDGPGEMGDALPTVALGTGRTAKAITAGYNNTCALLDDATVKCWGVNATGELGQGDKTYRGWGPNQMGDALLPIDLGPGRTARAVTGTVAHCALLDDDAIKCWGSNFKGALGLGDTTNRGTTAGQMGANLPAVALF
jgi:alpha-tubulin suppressor-like RCC1 family protein